MCTKPAKSKVVVAAGAAAAMVRERGAVWIRPEIVELVVYVERLLVVSLHPSQPLACCSLKLGTHLKLGTRLG